MAESLVALRDRREQVIARLSEGYAADLFDVDELDRRLDIAHAARTVAELDALVADFAATPAAAPAASTALVATGSHAIDDPTRPQTKQLRVIFGSVERRGAWVVPRALTANVWFGSSELDFRSASIGPGVTTLEVSVAFGSIEVIVPPWLAVDVDVSSLGGSVEERHRLPPEDDPSRPLLRITGAVRFGSLEISTRLPGESALGAWRRERGDRRRRRKQEREERRALRHGDRRALPPGSGDRGEM